MRQIFPLGCLPFMFFLLILLIPLFLADVMLTALSRLGLAPLSALITGIGIFLGGIVNIPVKQVRREQPIDNRPSRLYGLDRFFPRQTSSRNYTVIAVNLGGCVIPACLAVYELLRLLAQGAAPLMAALFAIAINVGICYWLARPIPNTGIALPALVPGITAALLALLFMPDFAPPVAFAAGVLGPLIGADLLHLKDIRRIATRVASIGGAGTFDGIVISGLLATLLVPSL